MPVAFEFDEINRKNESASVTLNRDFANIAADILIRSQNDRDRVNTAIVAFGKQLKSAVAVLYAQKTICDFDVFNETAYVDEHGNEMGAQ